MRESPLSCPDLVSLQVGSVIVGVAEGEGEFRSLAGVSTTRVIKMITGKPGSIVRVQVIPPGGNAKSDPQVIVLERRALGRW